MHAHLPLDRDLRHLRHFCLFPELLQWPLNPSFASICFSMIISPHGNLSDLSKKRIFSQTFPA